MTTKSIERTQRATQFRAVSVGDALPAGVCGRFTGVALTYGVPDDYGTVFVPGCLTRTVAEKVAKGKVKIFADHGPFTDTHVGVVRSIDDVGDSAVMTADLFDTDAGRSMKQYLEAVLASGADTGLSIGFRPRQSDWRKDETTGDMFIHFSEIELREVSITPVPAVPGTEVTSVRHVEGESDVGLLKRALRHILGSLEKREAQAVFDTVYAPGAATSEKSDASPPVPPVAIPQTGAEEAESARSLAADGERARIYRSMLVAVEG